MSNAQEKFKEKIDDFISRLEDLKDEVENANSGIELEGKFDEVNEEFKGLKASFDTIDDFSCCDECGDTFDDADLEDGLCESCREDEE